VFNKDLYYYYYIKNLLKNYYPLRDLRSSKKNLLVVPAFHTNSYGRRAFSVVALLLWNSLPQHIRDAGSLDMSENRFMKKTAMDYKMANLKNLSYNFQNVQTVA